MRNKVPVPDIGESIIDIYNQTFIKAVKSSNYHSDTIKGKVIVISGEEEEINLEITGLNKSSNKVEEIIKEGIYKKRKESNEYEVQTGKGIKCSEELYLVIKKLDKRIAKGYEEYIKVEYKEEGEVDLQNGTGK